MTKLIVTPIDMAAPGSYAERKKLLRAAAQIQQAQKSNSIADMVDALDALEALIKPHLQTDDGSPVAEALEQLSANEFDNLIGALVGGETIPNVKSEP